MLQGYDKNKVQFLKNGFIEGFKLGFNGSLNEKCPNNLISALEMPEITEEKILKESRANRIEGPFVSPPFENLHISPIGLQPKKSLGEFRLIHHLSYPRGLSVNDGILPELKSVSYQSVDDAVSAIKWVGQGCYMAKTDIKSAFRLVPVHPSDHFLLGFKWRGRYYYDKCLPMECSSSCRIFEVLSCALEWIATNKLGIPAVIHVLDDFLFIAPTEQMAKTSLGKFLQLCESIGIPIAHEKTEGPSRVMTFLGIELDSEVMQATLPSDKIEKCRTLITQLLHRNKVRLRELQSVIGTLNFACAVVRPGRTFLRRLINLTVGASRTFHHIRLNKQAKADLLLWARFLGEFNGSSFFIKDDLYNNTFTVATDAASTLGYGLVFGAHWAYGAWESGVSSCHITILELYPIVLATYLFQNVFSNKSVLFRTDNEALVPIINKGTSKDAQIMQLLRLMVLQCLKANILVRAKHIAGVDNERPDCLSRLQVDKFKSLSRGIQMDNKPVVIPEHLKLSVMLAS